MLIVSCDERDALLCLCLALRLALGADFLVKGVSCSPLRVGKRSHCLARSSSPRFSEMCCYSPSSPLTSLMILIPERRFSLRRGTDDGTMDAAIAARFVLQPKSSSLIVKAGRRSFVGIKREGLAESHNTTEGTTEGTKAVFGV